jgi:hypothetical protein
MRVVDVGSGTVLGAGRSSVATMVDVPSPDESPVNGSFHWGTSIGVSPFPESVVPQSAGGTCWCPLPRPPDSLSSCPTQSPAPRPLWPLPVCPRPRSFVSFRAAMGAVHMPTTINTMAAVPRWFRKGRSVHDGQQGTRRCCSEFLIELQFARCVSPCSMDNAGS